MKLKKLFQPINSKKNVRPIMIEGRVNYLSILSKENVRKSLLCEEAIKEHAAKKCRKNSIAELCGAVN